MYEVSLSVVETIFGSISAGACLTVIATYFLFADLRCLRFVELVFYVSINDMIASVGIALGKVQTGSFACWFQGLSTNINYLSSMFWTTVITVQIWLIVMRGTTLQDMGMIHLVCWVVPVVVSLLPLTTNTYGNEGTNEDWCFISNRPDSPRYGILMWEILSFYVWVWVAILVNMVLLIQSRIALVKILAVGLQDVLASQRILRKCSKLIWYPRILMFCWTASTVTDIADLFNVDRTSHAFRTAVWLSAILAVSQGWLLAVAFFAMNPIVRFKWYGLFTSKPVVYQNNVTQAYTFDVEGDMSVRDSAYSIYSVQDEPDYVFQPSISNRNSHMDSISRRSTESSVEFRNYSTTSNKVMNPIQATSQASTAAAILAREGDLLPSSYHRIAVATPTTSIQTTIHAHGSLSPATPLTPAPSIGAASAPTSLKDSDGSSNNGPASNGIVEV